MNLSQLCQRDILTVSAEAPVRKAAKPISEPRRPFGPLSQTAKSCVRLPRPTCCRTLGCIGLRFRQDCKRIRRFTEPLRPTGLPPRTAKR